MNELMTAQVILDSLSGTYPASHTQQGHQQRMAAHSRRIRRELDQISHLLPQTADQPERSFKRPEAPLTGAGRYGSRSRVRMLEKGPGCHGRNS